MNTAAKDKKKKAGQKFGQNICKAPVLHAKNRDIDKSILWTYNQAKNNIFFFFKT